MRSLATALLLLLLPGLLLPAGLLLHICRCTAPVASPAAHDCCAAGTPAEAAADRGSCCGHAARGAPAEEPAGLPTTQAHDCGCVWVPLADDQPDPTRPEPAPVASLAAYPTHGPVLPPSNAAIQPYAADAARSRPPPDHQRSLPLRL